MSRTGDEFRENIFSCIHITIMLRATFTTNPPPYSKACDTFRPRIGLSSAIRAGLGGISLIHFFKPRAMLNSLVRQLTTKGRPTRIQYRLGHVGLGQSGSGHIAHCNQIKLTHDAGAELVQEITPLVGNLRSNGFDSALLTGALGDAKLCLQTSVETRRRNLDSIGQCAEVLESQINAHTGVDRPLQPIGYLYANIDKPIASPVLGEVAAVFDCGILRQSAGLKHPKIFAMEVKASRGFFDVSTFEWNPAKVLSATVTKIRTLLLVSRFGVLLAHSIDGARMNAKLFARASGELVQVKAAEPFAAKTQRVLLAIIAVVEDKVDSARLLVQQAVKRFNSVSVNQNHNVYIISIRVCGQVSSSCFIGSTTSAIFVFRRNSSAGRAIAL